MDGACARARRRPCAPSYRRAPARATSTMPAPTSARPTRPVAPSRSCSTRGREERRHDGFGECDGRGARGVHPAQPVVEQQVGQGHRDDGEVGEHDHPARVGEQRAGPVEGEGGEQPDRREGERTRHDRSRPVPAPDRAGPRPGVVRVAEAGGETEHDTLHGAGPRVAARRGGEARDAGRGDGGGHGPGQAHASVFDRQFEQGGEDGSGAEGQGVADGDTDEVHRPVVEGRVRQHPDGADHQPRPRGAVPRQAQHAPGVESQQEQAPETEGRQPDQRLGRTRGRLVGDGSRRSPQRRGDEDGSGVPAASNRHGRSVGTHVCAVAGGLDTVRPSWSG
ncbi:hypothetical protein SAMN05443575_1595 [Jatrophihabitans endophyticus]|uniref:Uncharacterized protein n=1 Tax=Jatrophihabitans endophyticus TaxID=1206085 RepID=A0A1M5HPX5_9ACTN|nr:hypothetical protein SAMN05443575_1595 [Jatrophihabitans endophyticus]